ncbi:MAG TPA: CBS domain-containing protein [Casimicrobiaceae bacterium]|jgi:CBS domain-containing protein|nr:CBS domain-containing protein [Casimicrobiaceae bacterium]
MSPAFFSQNFDTLRDTDTVAAATERMLEHRVSDLPIVDADGKLVGIFTLARLLAGLLPSAVLVGYGVPDLAFIPDDLDTLRRKMREIESAPVREFAAKPEHVVHPDTSPVEIVLQLYRGANNLPVVDRDSGRLVAMVSARDLLAVLHGQGGR